MIILHKTCFHFYILHQRRDTCILVAFIHLNLLVKSPTPVINTLQKYMGHSGRRREQVKIYSIERGWKRFLGLPSSHSLFCLSQSLLILQKYGIQKHEEFLRTFNLNLHPVGSEVSQKESHLASAHLHTGKDSALPPRVAHAHGKSLKIWSLRS